MRSTLGQQFAWPRAIRRYLMSSLLLHLGWETLQFPLYTIWSTGLGNRTFTVVHCTIGDAMIAGLALLVALAVLDKPLWPARGTRSVWLVTLLLGVAYTASGST